jgi:hypothetical protein
MLGYVCGYLRATDSLPQCTTQNKNDSSVRRIPVVIFRRWRPRNGIVVLRPTGNGIGKMRPMPVSAQETAKNGKGWLVF